MQPIVAQIVAFVAQTHTRVASAVQAKNVNLYYKLMEVKKNEC